MRRKTHKTPCIVEDFSNNEDISSCFSSWYEALYNSVSFDSVEAVNVLTRFKHYTQLNVLHLLEDIDENLRTTKTCE